MGAKYFGASVRRTEDPRFLRGEGRYVDDIKLPRLLHAAFVRSPHGHAKVLSVKTEAARRLAGVSHVFAFADLERWMSNRSRTVTSAEAKAASASPKPVSKKTATLSPHSG